MPLFDSKTQAIGTTAVQVFANFDRPTRTRALLSAHPDNTGVIYVGSSDAVSVTKTDATAGQALVAGASTWFPISAAVNGLTELDIYAIATASGQYLYAELQ